MAYFTKDKLAQLAVTRGARVAYVHDAQRAGADNVYLVEHLVTRILPLVRDEAREFTATFGEPLPQHMRLSLEAEISMWEQLQTGLKTLARTEIAEGMLDAYTRRVCSYLGCQEDLLRMEQEMVTSCLVQHYDDVRGRIIAAAASYDITNI
jgi:hypothetical protein